LTAGHEATVTATFMFTSRQVDETQATLMARLLPKRSPAR
jgi:hypothetical protein